MNFYAFNIGDYAGATRHLTWDEDMAYRRMLDAYYSREAPLPLDRRQIYRLVGASEERQREAVDAVLVEFFVEQEDGWHNNRADEEIGKAAEKSTVRAERKENERERQRRHRARRKELFELLRERGIVPKFDTPTAELEEIARHAPVTVTERDSVTGQNAPSLATRDVQRDTAHVTRDGSKVTRDNTRDISPVTPDITANNPNPNPNNIEDDGKIARAPAINTKLFREVEHALQSIPEAQGHPVAINTIIAPIYRLVADRGLDLHLEVIPSIRRQLLASRKPVKSWGYFVDGIIQDASHPTLSAGAKPNGSPRRKTASEKLADAFDRVDAHIASRDTGS